MPDIAMDAPIMTFAKNIRTAEDVLIVYATWDTEASVWVAVSDDVPGLVIEADSTEALTEQLDEIIPELLALNKALHKTSRGRDGLPYRLISQRDRVIPNAA